MYAQGMEKKLIHTQQELDELGVGAHIWGSSELYPGVPGTGTPYSKEASGTWWDFQDGDIASEDIRLPAILVWEGGA
mgnify:CR=1 FL=1